MPDFIDINTVHHVISTYGYWAVLLFVGMEGTGIPVPGETALITAALYAGTTHNLDIGLVVATAAGGAILGDNAGYWIGRELGYPLLLRYGPKVGITEPRLKLGRYLFLRHGGKVVFFARFVTLLRVLAALLAGATHMVWPRFALFNALGAATWAATFGFGAYAFGAAIDRVSGPIGMTALVLGAMAVAAGFLFLRRNGARLEREAQRAFPD